ncbi:MAG: PAS domain S-box protein, partial [Sphingobacteriales bacterium]
VINRQTGKTRILRSKGKVLFDEQGKAHALTGIIQDITTQASIQQQIEESEKNLRNIILQAPVAMCLLKGEDFVVSIANSLMLQTWGKSADELMHKPLFEGLPEAKNQGFEDLLLNVYKTGETFVADGEPVSLPRNGEMQIVYLNFVYEAYREANNEITGVMALAVDVTEQVIARQKIELAEERARLAIESAELGVYEVNLLTDEIHTNTRFDQIFGFSHKVSRSEYTANIFPEDKEIRAKAHKEAVQTGQLFYEARILLPQGQVRWFRARGIVVYDNQKNPVKLLGVIQDITDQKQFADNLTKQVADKTADYQQAMEQLVKKNQELEQFAYVASHDLKEPLRMISSYSHLLLRHVPNNPDAAEYARFMSEGVNRMQALINDLLEYSRIGQKPVPPTNVDCDLVMQNVLDTLHITIEETGAKIEYKNLPQVLGVPSLLSQLFQNLVDNAIKFRKQNTTPQIQIAAEQHDGKWLFSFSDNGIGIPEKYRERIFVIFQRLHTRDQYPGTGIGLSVCKRIVELHGGEIWLQSEKDKGTTFYFTLPVAHSN